MSLKSILIAADQFCNALIGGSPDETLSARAWRLRKRSQLWSVARLVIDTIFFLDPDHCETSYLSELLRKQLPNEYRGVGNG